MDKEHMCVDPEKFAAFVNKFENFQLQMKKEIKEIPDRVLDTKIEVVNSTKRTLTIKTAISENWVRTSHIANGAIDIHLQDSDGLPYDMKLTDIIKKLKERPMNTFNKIGKFSDTASKIIRFLEVSGIFYLIYLLLTKQP